MAYGDESPLVGLNYVRDAVTNLTLADAAATLSMPYPTDPVPHAPAAIPPSKPQGAVKLEGRPIAPNGDAGMSVLEQYGESKSNSSLLKRLAERFGLQY